MVYRTGLAQGVAGENHLAWQIEVGNDADVREFVYVDAHSGKIIDRLPGIIDAHVPPRLRRPEPARRASVRIPASPYWVEGQAFPTASTEANNMITSSKETYDFYNERVRPRLLRRRRRA